MYSLFYLISPRHCHAFIGYLEEEAVKTYTHCLADIDQVPYTVPQLPASIHTMGGQCMFRSMHLRCSRWNRNAELTDLGSGSF